MIGEDPENDRHVQIGVVYGSLEECTDRNFPSLFARLDDYKILSFVRSTAFGENIAPLAKGTCLLKIYLDDLILILIMEVSTKTSMYYVMYIIKLSLPQMP